MSNHKNSNSVIEGLVPIIEALKDTELRFVNDPAYGPDEPELMRSIQRMLVEVVECNQPSKPEQITGSFVLEEIAQIGNLPIHLSAVTTAAAGQGDMDVPDNLKDSIAFTSRIGAVIDQWQRHSAEAKIKHYVSGWHGLSDCVNDLLAHVEPFKDPHLVGLTRKTTRIMAEMEIDLGKHRQSLNHGFVHFPGGNGPVNPEKYLGILSIFHFVFVEMIAESRKKLDKIVIDSENLPESIFEEIQQVMEGLLSLKTTLEADVSAWAANVYSQQNDI